LREHGNQLALHELSLRFFPTSTFISTTHNSPTTHIFPSIKQSRKSCAARYGRDIVVDSATLCQVRYCVIASPLA